jgi:glycosyltransferase involved in cell wall biosynthesis
MYENQHLLIIPRRYGGLCLPALEAAACGLVVAMPDVSPNEELAAIRIPVGRSRPAMFAAGKMDMAECNAVQIAEILSRLAANKEQMQQARIDQMALLPTWDVWRDKYMKAFKELL